MFRKIRRTRKKEVIMKTKYFKNNKQYFNFVNKNKDRKIKVFICNFTKNMIKVVYQFD